MIVPVPSNPVPAAILFLASIFRHFTISRCKTGDAVITIGGDLKAKWCIHAVGPNYRVEMQAHGKSAEKCDQYLMWAYLKSMKLAERKRMRAIAFSLISAGATRLSKHRQ